jgi:hypothetical protein
MHCIAWLFITECKEELGMRGEERRGEGREGKRKGREGKGKKEE